MNRNEDVNMPDGTAVDDPSLPAVKPHTFERSPHGGDRCTVCGNDRDWHPRAWR